MAADDVVNTGAMSKPRAVRLQDDMNAYDAQAGNRQAEAGSGNRKSD